MSGTEEELEGGAREGSHSEAESDVGPSEGRRVEGPAIREARFSIGEIVHHRIHPFRGVIFDVDPTFANTEEWWLAIPEQVRPAKDQPYYHVLAENAKTTYVAYVSEQNLVHDESGAPCRHPQVGAIFEGMRDGRYVPRRRRAN